LANGSADPQQLLGQLGLTDVVVVNVDSTDGLRLQLADGRIIHLRPSGNAPELRCYAEATDVHEAQRLVTLALSRIQDLAL